MALAPTLLKFLNCSVGVGAATMVGLAVTAETSVRAPSQSALSALGIAPSVIVQLGPTADADVEAISLDGRAPFLLRVLVVAPGLPDTTPESNDLTPTLVWQEITKPTVGLATLGGLAPAVVGNTGQSIAISVGSAVIAGLAPTLDVPAGQSGTTLPGRVALEFPPREPSLLLELRTEISAPELLQLIGLAPTLSVQVGWEDIPSAETPNWNDVPTV